MSVIGTTAECIRLITVRVVFGPIDIMFYIIFLSVQSRCFLYLLQQQISSQVFRLQRRRLEEHIRGLNIATPSPLLPFDCVAEGRFGEGASDG